MRGSVLAMWCAALAAGGCHKSPSPQPRKPLTITREFDPQATGDPAFVVEGGPLRAAVTVPLLIEFEDPDETCFLHHAWLGFPTASGDFYLHQYNNWCGGDTCRILDGRTGALRVPEGGCIQQPSMGIHLHASSIGGDWIQVHGQAEGIAETTLGRYSESGGHRTMLKFDLGHLGSVEAKLDADGGLVLKSPCDLRKGGCENFLRQLPPPMTFVWSAQGGLKLVP